MPRHAWVLVALVGWLAACGDDEPGPEPDAGMDPPMGDGGMDAAVEPDPPKPDAAPGEDAGGVDDDGGAEDGGAQPLPWQDLGALPDDAVPLSLLATTANDTLLGTVEMGSGLLRVVKRAQDDWEPLGDGLQRDDKASGGALRLAEDGDGRPVALWTEGGAAHAAAWDGKTWKPLGTGPLGTTASLPDLGIDASGAPVAVWYEADGALHSARFDGSDWVPLRDPWALSSDPVDIRLAFVDGEARVLIVVAGELRMLRGTAPGPAWVECGAPLGVAPQSAARAVASATRGAKAAIAWEERDAQSSNVYVARLVADSCETQLLDAALDLEIDAHGLHPAVALDSDGEPLVAWLEHTSGSRRVLVARWQDPAWQVLGQALGGRAGPPLLTVDGGGDAVVAFSRSTGGPARAMTLDGTAELPFGIKPPTGASACTLPDESDEDFPTKLSQTGCFLDAAARQPAPGVVPYTVRSVLWSDGATKRRFLVLPEGEALGYDPTDPFSVPVGTIFIKEFLLPPATGQGDTPRPVETRFLIKRCDLGKCPFPWQGYSYRWNDDGDGATLLDNRNDPVLVEWPSGAASHTHVYPSRVACFECHAPSAGSVLGLTAGQLNHPLDFGPIVDNQLRALRHAGLLVDTPKDTPERDLPRLPRPKDPAHDLHSRVRSYLHSNCSHCHRPVGGMPVLDLRFDADFEADGNLCEHITPGDPDASLLYVKPSVREPDVPPGLKGDPMPPVGSLLPDTRQLATTHAWITSLSSCPP